MSQRYRSLAGQIFISLVILAAFIAVFWKYSSVPAAAALFLHANTALLVTAFVLYIGIYALRAWRFSLISPLKAFSNNFSLAALHNFFNNIMPANLGELSYPFFARRRYGVSYSAGFSTVVLARFFDVITVCLLLATVGLFFVLPDRGALSMAPIIFGSIGFFMAEALIVLAVWLMRNKLIHWFPRFAEKAFVGWTFRQYIGAATVSLAISIAMFADSVLIMRGLGVTAPLIFILLGNGLSLVSGILPIEAPFGIGTIEASWSLPLLAAGLSASASLAVVVDYHLITLVFSGVLVLIVPLM